MNTTKLREALAEMETMRGALDEAIASVKKIIASLEGTDTTQSVSAPSVVFAQPSANMPRSYIEDSVEIMRRQGAPMHIKELVSKLTDLRGSEVPRASVESSIIRHIAKANQPMLAKFARSTFGLAEWKEQPTLVQVAS